MYNPIYKQLQLIAMAMGQKTAGVMAHPMASGGNPSGIWEAGEAMPKLLPNMRMKAGGLGMEISTSRFGKHIDSESYAATIWAWCVAPIYGDITIWQYI